MAIPKQKACIDCGKIHSNISQVCTNCILFRQQARKSNMRTKKYYMHYTSSASVNFYPGQIISLDPDDLLEIIEMPKATLSYEALTVDTEGNVTEGAYRLKLEGNFRQHIEPIVKFIKASIPSSERTYDPTTYEWFYHEKWHPFMEQAFKGSHYTVVYGVTKEAFTDLKRKQAEWAKQAGQSFQHKQYDTNEDIEIFGKLIAATNTGITNGAFKNWSKNEAITAYKKAIRFYHPDIHPERAAQASELNEVWSRLKEGYYIK